MPRQLNQAKTKSKPEAKAKQTSAGAAEMGSIKAPCCTRDADKERPDPTSVPIKLDMQQEINNRTSSAADAIHKACLSPSLECSQLYRSPNSRTSKAERVLGLTSQDLEADKKLGRSSRQAPTISIDSPRTPTPSRHPPSAAQSTDPHQRCHSQKSASKSRGGVLRLPAEHHSVTQAASSSDLKLVGEGSEVESDADQSSVGDTGSARSSPFPKKKSTESRGRDRFKKILRPLTRSKSAGAGDRVPAYALFLRHQPHPVPSVVNRSTDNVMRNSADGTESEDEGTDGATSQKVSATHKDKKDRFAFFRRSAEGHSKNAFLPSMEILQGWTKAFDKLLADSYGLKLFREFLRREFSDENIEFWIECDKYRHLTSEKHRSTEAKRIFREYVAVQAPKEINLDSKTREATEASISRADTKVFEAAQKRIEALMEKDSYPRFLQSDLFQRLLQQRQAADNSLKVT